MRTSTKLIIPFLLLFCGFTINGQDLLTPKKIKTKGDFTHTQTKFLFPEEFNSFQRQDIFSYDKKKLNISVSYGNQKKQSILTIYVYPAGEGYEGRLKKEYLKSMQSIANLSEKGIHATQFAVRKEGEYICNGFKAIITQEQNKYNSLTLYECGQWFLKVRITSNNLDSTQIALLEQNIYSHYDPTKLTALNPLNTKANVYFNKNTAFRDSILLGSAMGSAFKKINWAIDNVKENERASGFPGLYLNLQVESLKAFMEFQHRFNYKQSEFTKQYLKELQLISDAGFLAEFVMDQFEMILIIPKNTPAKYEEYETWKLNNKLTIDLNQEFYVVSYGQKK